MPASGPRYGRMSIIRSSPSVPCPADPARIAVALARLCEREGLDAGETTAVLAVALARAPGLPRNLTPLLRQFTLAA